jgi:predicted glycosyltransferase
MGKKKKGRDILVVCVDEHNRFILIDTFSFYLRNVGLHADAGFSVRK